MIHLAPDHIALVDVRKSIAVTVFIRITKTNRIIVIIESTVGGKVVRSVACSGKPSWEVASLKTREEKLIRDSYKPGVIPLVDTLSAVRQKAVKEALARSEPRGAKFKAPYLKLISRTQRVSHSCGVGRVEGG